MPLRGAPYLRPGGPGSAPALRRTPAPGFQNYSNFNRQALQPIKSRKASAQRSLSAGGQSSSPVPYIPPSEGMLCRLLPLPGGHIECGSRRVSVRGCFSSPPRPFFCAVRTGQRLSAALPHPRGRCGLRSSSRNVAKPCGCLTKRSRRHLECGTVPSLSVPVPRYPAAAGGPGGVPGTRGRRGSAARCGGCLRWGCCVCVPNPELAKGVRVWADSRPGCCFCCAFFVVFKLPNKQTGGKPAFQRGRPPGRPSPAPPGAAVVVVAQVSAAPRTRRSSGVEEGKRTPAATGGTGLPRTTPLLRYYRADAVARTGAQRRFSCITIIIFNSYYYFSCPPRAGAHASRPSAGMRAGCGGEREGEKRWAPTPLPAASHGGAGRRRRGRRQRGERGGQRAGAPSPTAPRLAHAETGPELIAAVSAAPAPAALSGRAHCLRRVQWAPAAAARAANGRGAGQRARRPRLYKRARGAA